MGDLQDDWYEALDKLKTKNLSGKKVGLIGIGDQFGFGDTFVDGIGTIYEEIKDMGINLVGKTSTDGYSFSGSKAVVDDEFVGLVIDENNQSELTDEKSMIAGTGAQSPINVGKQAAKIGEAILNDEDYEKTTYIDTFFIGKDNVEMYGTNGWQ
mgnify:CR=1 FL=1